MALVDRVKRILLNPRQEWEVIDTEATTPADLYTRYVMPLAAIPPVAQLIGFSVFGMRIPFVGTYRVPVMTGLLSAAVTYVLSLVGVYLLALLIDNLAPNFGGQRSQIQALKASAYSATASWVAGIFSLIPGLRILGILGLYSLYLLYLGLPVVMKAPRERALGYTVVVVIAAIVLYMIIAVVASRLVTMPSGVPT